MRYGRNHDPLSRTEPCKHCGKGIWLMPCQFGKKKFCSVSCYKTYQVSEPGILERFWASVVKTDTCWLFQLLEKDGYGYFRHGRPGINQEQWFAHRFIWTRTHGPIPDGKAVCHTCDVRNCVNPAHLWLGTHDENMADLRTKKANGRRAGNRYTPVDELLYPEHSRRWTKPKEKKVGRGRARMAREIS